MQDHVANLVSSRSTLIFYIFLREQPPCQVFLMDMLSLLSLVPVYGPPIFLGSISRADAKK